MKFLEFLRSLGLGDNQYIKDLQQVNSVLFVTQLKSQLDKYKGSDDTKVENGFGDLVKQLNIDTEEYKKEDITKFKRFILYLYIIQYLMLLMIRDCSN